MFLLGFVYQLRDIGLPVGLDQVLDFYRGLEKGLARNMDELFLFGRLCFAKRVEHMDPYERAFLYYFQNIDLPPVAEGDPELLYTKQFRQWLQDAIQRGDIPETALWRMSREELMEKFWKRLNEQMDAHHGGNRWIGTGGTSPFGHSGFAERGFRVMGEGRRRSALKVIGDRRYVAYDSHHSLTGANIRQVLGTMRHMIPAGPRDELDLDDTIAATSRNGGEIDLVFRRRKLDRIKLLLLIDNGGTSMMPFVRLTRLLFSKIQDRFQRCDTYYFHNTIYDKVYSDDRRTKPVPLKKLLTMSPETRVFIIGDASMAPEELLDPYGAINFEAEDHKPSIQRLRDLQRRFRYSVWLNPILKEEWPRAFGAWTIREIGKVFKMEDLTLRGIRAAVEHLQRIES